MMGLAVLAIAALLAAGCEATSPYAVVVNGTTVTETNLLKELHALASSKQWANAYDTQVQQAAGQGQSLPALSNGNGSVTQGFTDLVLSFRIRATLSHDEVVRRHIQPSPADVGANGGTYALLLGTAGGSLPKWLQHTYQVRGAEQAALGKSLPPVASDAAAVQKFYNDHPENFITAQCTSHIEVSSRQLAFSLLARIRNGEDFKALARRYSLDAATASKGGSLGCNPPSQFGVGFEDAALTTPVGQVSEPVHTSAGWHLIKVDSRQTQQLDAATRTQIQQQLQQTDPVLDFLNGQERTVKVTVNPAFGTWEPVLGEIIPPPSPGAQGGATTTTAP